MNNNTGSAISGSIFFELLTVAFVVLKLCHVIEWSWWWVLAPLWIPVAILIVILIGFIIWTKCKGGEFHWHWRRR